MVNPYDKVYRSIDWNKKPFEIPLKHYNFVAKIIKTRIKELLPASSVSLLDVGGGFGALHDFLWEQQKARYANVDVSKTMLSMSKGERLQGVAEALPIKDACFEAVVCSEVLEHVNDKEETLRELYRVLKEGGTLVLTTPRSARNESWNKAKWKAIFLLTYFALALPQFIKQKVMLTKKAGKRPIGTKDEPTDENWLFDFLQQLGFTVVEFDRVFAFWKRYSWFPVWFLNLMEQRYKGSKLCHAMVFKAIKAT